MYWRGRLAAHGLHSKAPERVFFAVALFIVGDVNCAISVPGSRNGSALGRRRR